MNRKLVYGLTFAVVIFGIILGVLLVYKKPPALPGTPGTSSENCPATALVYVYLNDQQKNAADSVTSNLKMALYQSGINIMNLPLCPMSAKNMPRELRAYPSILIKGNVSIPSPIISGELYGYKIVNPAIAVYFSLQAGVKPVFPYVAKLYLINGTSPFSGVKVNEMQLKSISEIMGYLSLSNITDVKIVSSDDLKLNLVHFPSIVLDSGYNLSNGCPYIVNLGNNYYLIEDDILQKDPTGQFLLYTLGIQPLEAKNVLLQLLGARAYEIRKPPYSELFSKGVKIGDSDNLLFILEDYHCPYCAMLINSTGNMLYNYAKTGKLQVVLVDLIIHSEVIPMHAIAKCAYNQTKDGYAYFNVSQELYHLAISGTATTVADVNKTVAKYFGKNILDKCAPLLNSYQSDILAFSNSLMQQGFTGTPTLIFWSNKTHKGLIVEGCLDIKACITEQQFSQILSWLQG
jgi:protein-disulfide isomerase